MKAKFISFEGGEGVGKSTQIALISEYLAKNNVDYITTREVGGCGFSEKMRQILFEEKNLYPMSELLQIMSARYQHVNEIIIPALKENKWVLCDRFVDSTAAYQGVDLGIDIIYELHDKLIHLLPDLTIFLDLSPEIALKRAMTRGNNNKFEAKNNEFHMNVYNNFHIICKKFSKRIIKFEVDSLNEIQVNEILKKIVNLNN
jgi:dTMP kinase